MRRIGSAFLRHHRPRGRARGLLGALVLGLHVLITAQGLALAAGAGQAAEKIQVYVKPVEPFVFTQNGQSIGYSIDLWQRVAQEAGFQYELHTVKTVAEMLDALRAGKADVGVGALSITSEREAVIDFSHPFYESGLSILVGAQGARSPGSVISHFLTLDALRLVGILVLALLVAAHCLWFFEKRKNPQMFPPDYLHGIAESLWWTISIIITGGCENKAPIGLAGRLVAIVWMLMGIFTVSYLTASVTTTLTVNQLTADISGPGDLQGFLVATVQGSTAERYLLDRKIDTRALPTIEDAYGALARHEVKAVVYDAPVLLYHVSRGGASHMRVVGRIFEKQNYGLGLQADSKHRKQINEVLLRLKEGGYFEDLQKKWFGMTD